MIDSLRSQPEWRSEIITGRSASFPDNLVPPDIRVQALRMFRPIPGWLGDKSAYPLGFARALRRRATAASIVHVHGLWRYPSMIGAPLLRSMRVPYVVSPHGLLMRDPLNRHGLVKRAALRLGERRNLTEAAGVLVSSSLELQGLADLGVTPSRITVVPLGISREASEFFDAHRGEPSLRRNVILSVARIHPIKQLDKLVAAFELLEAPNWSLEIVGPIEDAVYAERLRARLSSPKLAGRAALLGEIRGADLWRRYLACGVFVLASRSENFGLAVLEALTAGAPVITTTGTMWRDLESEGAGWCVEDSVLELVRTLTIVLSMTPAQRAAVSVSAHTYAEMRYSHSRATQALISAYERALLP